MDRTAGLVQIDRSAPADGLQVLRSNGGLGRVLRIVRKFQPGAIHVARQPRLVVRAQPGDDNLAVRLNEDGSRVHHGSDPAREGTIVRLARDRRLAYVRWDGLRSVTMIVHVYLQRVSL